ncbi:hypothetical protein F5Y04DRAFT_214214 [Hypomontagnella monticulosa]|nr:hypothetical protein F5Y04DRAFT_214214 [Hypomontagnella monticulosa]
MGGNVFTSLLTPRMSPTVYDQVRRRCSARLRELFTIVVTPIPGPAKKDYGDIDFLVAWEKSVTFPTAHSKALISSLAPSNRDPLEAAARHLRAHATHREQAKALNIAIPWPDDLRLRDIAHTEEDLYIQVDLNLVDTQEQLTWMIFRHAHGDFWNICGSIIRPYGLTIDDEGMYIRIPEIEHLNRKEAKVLLTKEPAEVLEFLGLEGVDTRWKEPFSSTEELFEYAASCRLFWVFPEKDDDPTTKSGEAEHGTLKSNDRRRMKYRPLFREWIEVFLPACRQAGRFMSNDATRDTVRQDAFNRFPLAEYGYYARLIKWRNEQQRISLFRNVIKTAIPTQQEGEEERLGSEHWRSVAAGAFKKIIMQDDYSLGIRPETPLRDANGSYDEGKVKRYVEGNWKQVGDVAWQANLKRSTEKVAAKRGLQCKADTEKQGGANISLEEQK